MAADVSAAGLITDDKRRTTTKVRIVTARKQQVARVDYETDAPAPPQIEVSAIDQSNRGSSERMRSSCPTIRKASSPGA